MNTIPENSSINKIIDKHLQGGWTFERVEEGTSTFVYRLTQLDQTLYLRLSKGDSDFKAEVLVHQVLTEAGVRLPEVLYVGCLDTYPYMIISQIEGESLESRASHNLAGVLFKAGKDLAQIHKQPVEGVGFLSLNDQGLRGQSDDFYEDYHRHLAEDLAALDYYDFTRSEKASIQEASRLYLNLIKDTKPCLVHGDYDISHIFHKDGSYQGLIDFGEVRGHHPMYDLATFLAFYQNQDHLDMVLKGYTSRRSVTIRDRQAIDYIAFFLLLRFLGKKYNHRLKGHFQKLMRLQLNRLKEWEADE